MVGPGPGPPSPPAMLSVRRRERGELNAGQLEPSRDGSGRALSALTIVGHTGRPGRAENQQDLGQQELVA